MAKRKRLDPTPAAPAGAQAAAPEDAAPETKSIGVRYPLGVAPTRTAPIASVAGDGAAQAALAEVSAEMARARAEGRMVVKLPLDAINADYLVRDRVAADPEEMASLKESLRARGQQAPIEVTDLGGGRYGLISGWRRLIALRALERDGYDGGVLALLRVHEAAAGAYLAMIEENEIRAALSFYERARIVARAADSGVFADDRAALSHLFSAAPRARRSKIGSFVRIVRALETEAGPVLRFPADLSEKLGLAVAGALARDEGLAERLTRDFLRTPAETPDEEARRLATHLRRAPASEVPAPAAAGPERPEPDIHVTFEDDTRVTLEGAGVATPEFRKALLRWVNAGKW